MSLEETLEQFRARGAWDSEGSFSVDRSGAWQRMQAYAFERPGQWILKVLQYAVRAGASRFEVKTLKNAMLVTFDAAAMSEETLRQIFHALRDGVMTTSSDELLWGLVGAQASGVSRLLLDVERAEVRTFLEPASDRFGQTEATGTIGTHLFLRWDEPVKKKGWTQRWCSAERPERRELLSAALYSPLAIVWDDFPYVDESPKGVLPSQLLHMHLPEPYRTLGSASAGFPVWSSQAVQGPASPGLGAPGRPTWEEPQAGHYGELAFRRWPRKEQKHCWVIPVVYGVALRPVQFEHPGLAPIDPTLRQPFTAVVDCSDLAVDATGFSIVTDDRWEGRCQTLLEESWHFCWALQEWHDRHRKRRP